MPQVDAPDPNEDQDNAQAARIRDRDRHGARRRPHDRFAQTAIIVVHDHADVSATFAQIFNLSVRKSKTGTVAADQRGVEETLSCGGTCSVKCRSE